MDRSRNYREWREVEGVGGAGALFVYEKIGSRGGGLGNWNNKTPKSERGRERGRSTEYGVSELGNWELKRGKAE